MQDKISRILIIRNDFTTAWEDSFSYRLKKGELGIGYLDNGNVIVKVGKLDADGNNLHWKDCPQVEGVLENDLLLTYDFGKYKISNGYVNAGGKGQTISQWLMSALHEEKNPQVVQPSYTLNPKEIITNNNSTEIGSLIERLDWESNFYEGSYEYGSFDSDGNYTSDTSTDLSVEQSFISDIQGTIEYDITGGTLILQNKIKLNSTEQMEYASITGTCGWGDSPKIPVNNLGNKCDECQIKANLIEKKITYSAKAYREGCFYGATEKVTSVADITSWLIRNLSNKLGEDYNGQSNLQCTIPVGSTAIIIATPKLQFEAQTTGPKKVFNSTVQTNMWNKDIFQYCQISVGGADSTEDNLGEVVADYNVYYYIPAHPYENETEIIIDLKKIPMEDE